MTEGRKFLLAIAILHAVFFILSLSVGQTRLPDSEDYIWQADNFAQNGSFYAANPSLPIKIDYYSKRPPLYALFIWAITSVINSLYAVIFIQNLLSIIAAWWVYKLLKDTFRVKRAAILTVLLWAAFPNQLLYANMVMSETLLQFFIVAAFYCFVRYWQNPQKTNYIYLNNAALALAMLTKPVMLYFWVINLVLLIVLAIKHKKYLLPIPVLIIPAIAMLWSEANFSKTGYRHYSSITHINLKDYNTKYFLFSKYGSQYGDSVIAVIDDKAATLPNYAAQARFIKDTCTSILLSDVPAYGKFHARGMLNFMADPGRYDYVSFFSIPQTDGLGLLHYLSKGNLQELKGFLRTQPLWLIVVLLVEMVANGLVLLLCIAYLFAKRTPLWPKLYLLALAGYIWFLTGPIGSARFKVPIYPLLIIAAVVGGVWLAQLWSKRKKVI